jgi:hypothetical protein
MYQVPAAVWNEIAASQPLSPQWARLFRMNPGQLGNALAMQAKELEAKGLDSKTIRAYQLVAPLLSENEAISSYLEESRRQDLRAALPEICSVGEALMLVTAEYRLMPSQQGRLRPLLEQLLNAPSETPSEQPAP